MNSQFKMTHRIFLGNRREAWRENESTLNNQVNPFQKLTDLL